MRRAAEPSSLKRKHPDGKSPAPNLSKEEQRLYEVIHSKGDMGMWLTDIKRELKNIPSTMIDKCLKSLQAKSVIKPVVNIKNKTKKYFMAVDFEPSSELTGGAWYSDGSFDMDFIQLLKSLCIRSIRQQKVGTFEQVSTYINKSGAVNVDCSPQQIGQILRGLVLDNEIMEDKSTGIGEFVKIRAGTVCYKCINKSEVPKLGALASIPCGVCPRISQCTPDGIISPITCKYYQKWFDF